MKKTSAVLLVTMIAGFIGGCVVRTGPVCRNECWWDHGRRVCERRCR